jgi:hypothetical protein
MNPAEISAQ